MSNGDKYHKDSLTCAHAKFPLGTLLRVTNIKNGKSVVVEVTDRCSSHSRRIIDLSYAAAKEIGILSMGMGMVRVEKYRREVNVPYRDDEELDLPELDYEVTENKTSKEPYSPAWRKARKK